MQKEIEYVKVGDYYFPKLEVDEPIQALSRFGRLLLKYLKENEQGKYFKLKASNELKEYLINADKQMNDQYFFLLEEYKRKLNINEQLKYKNQIEWVKRMNSIENIINKIIIDTYIE